MKPIKPDDPRIPEMARLCAKFTGGIATREIIAESGMSRCLVQMLLAECRRKGLLMAYKPLKMGWLWLTPTDYAQVLVQVSGSRMERRRENARFRYHDRRASGLIDSSNRITDPPEWPITRRSVKAGTVPPPVTLAVNSVFALGAK